MYDNAGKAPAQERKPIYTKKKNDTGMPDILKKNLENNSGLSFDDVRIYYNSSKPAQLKAMAYTQGSRVYIGPGQEKHLNHELGHVVQQKQGRVRPTIQMMGLHINTETALEKEADKIGNVFPYAANREGGRYVPYVTQNSSAVIQGMFVDVHNNPVSKEFLDFIEEFIIDERIDDFRELRQEEFSTNLYEWFHDVPNMNKIIRQWICVAYPVKQEEEELFTIVSGLEQGLFGVRWLSLTVEQKNEIIARIRDQIPIVHSIAKDKLDEKVPFVIHGSSIWGNKNEQPNDIDVIYPSMLLDTDTHTISRDEFRAMHRKPKNDEIKISGRGSDIDTLLGIRFDTVYLQHDNAHAIAWEAVKEQVLQLIHAGNQELGNKNTAMKGTRKLVNALFIMRYYLIKWESKELSKFMGTWKEELTAANRALVGGKVVFTSGVNPNWITLMDEENAYYRREKGRESI